MKTFLLTTTLFLLSHCLFGQKHNNTWFFGSHAGLDFNSAIPIPIIGKLVSIGSPSSISDPNGKLLFYTNGQLIWDRNHNIMPNGNGLIGGPASAQPALIVPFPNTNSKYYVFTTEDMSTDGGMSYSIVDMNLNGGFGDILISSKNTLVVDHTADKVTAILHQNGKDIWVITHRFDSDEFLSYLITESGLSNFPIVSSVGSILPLNNGFGGPIKGSNHGSKLILASTNASIIELFNFDSSTGIISDVSVIDDYLNDQDDAYGVEFSPNDSLIYMMTFHAGMFINHLYQFHIQSHLLTDLNNPLKANPGGIQLGPNNKIYCKGGAEAVSVIHQPNEIGASCQFEYNSLLLEPATSTLAGFPSRVPYSFFLNEKIVPSLGKDTTLCIGDTIRLNANFPTNCDSTEYVWNDGSIESGLFVNQPGVYWVEIYSTCGIFRDTIQVEFTKCLPIVYYGFDACVSYMHNGTNIDYTEFEPTYPSLINCATVIANNAYRFPPQENKHSCTPGVNNSIAMCISSYNECSYSVERDEALNFDITIIPSLDSMFQLSRLEFYQKAPLNYDWIDGGSGLNNYPTKYGIRILKNGIEVFRKQDIETTQSWTLQSFDLNQDDFIVGDSAFFRVEILPYCLVSNGANVAAWDIDEVMFFGRCQSTQTFKPIIMGNVLTIDNKPVVDVKMNICKTQVPFIADETNTDSSGYYLFSNLEEGEYYTVKCYKNDDMMNGVSTLDLLLIQKHLLGILPFRSLNQFIAADINNNGNISVIDLLELRKMILGLSLAFPNNMSWRFGPLLQEMNNTNITEFIEYSLSEQVIKDTQMLDFIGIKVGDLNGDSRMLLQNSIIRESYKSSLKMIMSFRKYTDVDSLFLIIFRTPNDLNTLGAQFGIDLGELEFVSMRGSKFKVVQENISYNNGILRISWNSDEIISVSSLDTLFSIIVKGSASNLLNRISLLDECPKPEIYSENLDVMELALMETEIQSEIIDKSKISVSPNPANSVIKIRFYQENPGEVEIRLLDLSGHVLFKAKKYYFEGDQIEEINIDNLPIGLLVCQILLNGRSKFEMFFSVN